MEEWKDIPGYEGLYQVSDQGKVKSLSRRKAHGALYPERILRDAKSNSGYMRVVLCKESKTTNKSVHRLVAEAFIGESRLEVDHINGDKTDNRLINLRYATTRQNQHYYRHGKPCSSKYIGVSENKNKGTWMAKISIDGKEKYLGTFSNEIDAATEYQNQLKQIES